MGRWQGQADIELTDLGYEQARRATEKLGMFDAVISSDLRRAYMPPLSRMVWELAYCHPMFACAKQMLANGKE